MTSKGKRALRNKVGDLEEKESREELVVILHEQVVDKELEVLEESTEVLVNQTDQTDKEVLEDRGG